MKTVNSIILLVAMAFGLFFVAGCKGERDKKFRIGVSQCSGDYWREKINEDIMREQLLHENMEVVFRNADSNNDRQIEDIRYFIDNDFDLIMVSPNEAKELTPIVREAYDSGIPVVTFDRCIEGESFTAHMEVDNYELGRSVAQYAGSLIHGPLKVIEIQGPSSASPAQRRHSGFSDAIRENGDGRIIASVCGNWDDSLSASLTDSLLECYPEANLIYAHTDHMAIGAAKAARQKGRADIAVMGIDGFPHIGIQAVKDSLLTATFLYPSEGERLLRIAAAILEGSPYERINRVPPLSPIDRTNADILLSQDELMVSETAKINLLRGKLDEYLNRYATQRMLLLFSIIIVVLFGVLLFILLMAVNSHRRHRKVLLQKTRLLEEEKDKQRILYDRLQDATQSKLVFFTNVSHDLRTPLSLISGPVEEVVAADYLSPRHKSLMRIAHKNVTILRRMIDQILDFRKYENGKIDLNLSEVRLTELLKEWTESFMEMARKRDIHLCVDIESESGLTIAVDIEKMERVFFNLMSNAFKHTPDNGKISVSFTESPDRISIIVADTGSGISPDDRSKIFDRFFQAKSISHSGSGIGLALTKAFIELHGGTISVESEVGKGSEFTVTLPVRHCEHNEPEVSSSIVTSEIEMELADTDYDSMEFNPDNPLLLVIDDNRDIRRLIGELLGDSYNIIYASDGRKGVRMAVKYVPDLIICDVMMPEMDGMECVRRIKGEVSTSHIPVLMLTACSLDEQRVEGYESGADAYLPKPFNGSVLAARCRNLLMARKRIKEIYSPFSCSENQVSDKGNVGSLSVSAPNDVESDFYFRFAGIVEERLSQPKLNVDDIADAMNLSQSQLTRKIKALTNYTPVEIIRRMRLKRAGTLLLATEKTVSEIAFEVGFASLAYFSRCYKEEFGVSPTEVRGNKKNK